jgi:hypothetical protein
VNLSDFLVGSWGNSFANDVWSDGKTTYVAGYAFNFDTNRFEALLWVSALVCPGDASGDGVVDTNDLNVVLSMFGQSGGALAGDVNTDGIVDFDDLNYVLTRFGYECD